MHKYENVFALKYVSVAKSVELSFTDSMAYSQSFLAEIDAIAEQCNYTGYYNTYATYPPAPAPFPYYDSWDTDACDVWDAIFDAALVVNPGFDVYHIFSTVSLPRCSLRLHFEISRLCSGRSCGMSWGSRAPSSPPSQL